MLYMASGEACSLGFNSVAHRVHADLQHGLSTSEADRRRRVHGHNDFEITEEEPLWKKYLAQVKILFIIYPMFNS